jgi:hypothetical protein
MHSCCTSARGRRWSSLARYRHRPAPCGPNSSVSVVPRYQAWWPHSTAAKPEVTDEVPSHRDRAELESAASVPRLTAVNQA